MICCMNRLIQVWLTESPPGVAEVRENADKPNRLECTCQTFAKQGTCLHVVETARRIRINGGIFFLRTSTRPTPQEVAEAAKSPEAYRELILMRQEIEVLG